MVVIGGAGYIGSVLVRKLLEAGHETTVLDRLDYGEGSLAELFDDPRFRLVRADMRDADTLSAVVRGAGAVIHLGAIVGDAACDAEPGEAISINYQGAAAVGRAARAAGVERMLFASTCSVYGSAPECVDETSRLNPVSLYATTKIDAENLLLSWSEGRFRPTALRIGTAFGWSPRPRFDLAINLLSARAAFEKQASIYNSSRWRPFVHVDDIARGFVAVLEAPVEQVGGRIFNLGSSAMNRRLGDVGEALRRLYPDADVRYEATDDRRDYRVSFAKIERTLGFRALKSLEDGMLEIAAKIHGGAVEDYRAQKYHNHRLEPAAGAEAARPPAVWPCRRDPAGAPLIQGIGA